MVTAHVNPVALAILAYCLSSILMTVTNKIVLSNYSFRMNLLLLAIQSAVCVAMLEGFRMFGMIKRRNFRTEDAKRWMGVSMSLAAMIYTGSKALQYLSIPLFTIFKNLTIILIAYSERFLLKGAAVSRPMLLSFSMMVASSLIAAWSDLANGKMGGPVLPMRTDAAAEQAAALQVTWAVAYGWMMLNCLATAGFALLMKFKIKQVGFKEFDTVFYNNLLSIPILLVGSLLVESSQISVFYDQYLAPDAAGGPNPNRGELYGLVFGIALSGISSFGISYGTAWCMRVTSSTTYSMVGALNKLPIAVAGMVFFQDPVTAGGVAGVILAFLGGIVYTRAKSLQTGGAPVISPTSNIPLMSSIEPETESVRPSSGNNVLPLTNSLSSKYANTFSDSVRLPPTSNSGYTTNTSNDRLTRNPAADSWYTPASLPASSYPYTAGDNQGNNNDKTPMGMVGIGPNLNNNISNMASAGDVNRLANKSRKAALPHGYGGQSAVENSYVTSIASPGTSSRRKFLPPRGAGDMVGPPDQQQPEENPAKTRAREPPAGKPLHVAM
ncbi:hypothetical protein DFS34DRAFT_632516 [Phlyctochytrium arcticum]|nr:hypothetical protein DFS34DRAFT_632516 [Phlyctochytrium arcticum]